jgi:NDP-sugar pyrophosphorylase family protein
LIPDLDETFIVMNGDVLTTLDYAELVRYHEMNQASATIAMHRREVKIDLGVIELDGGNRIRDYVEKPRFDYRVSMGIYVFEPKVLSYVPVGEYLDFPDLIHRMLAGGETVVGYPHDGYWLDIGRPDDYARAIQDFESMHSELLGGS